MPNPQVSRSPMNRSTRRDFLQTSGTALAAGLALGCRPRAQEVTQLAGPRPLPQQPNVVLIMLDTLRADKCGCYGYDQDTTPALDALAERGVLFARAFSECPWTRPSVGAFLTGLHARALGLYSERADALNPRFDTLPKLFQAAGYGTFGATANPNLNELFGFHVGFDEYIDSRVVFRWMERQAGDALHQRTSLPQAPYLLDEAYDWARQRPAGSTSFMQLNLMEVHEWFAAPSYDMRRDEYKRLYLDDGEYADSAANPRMRQWYRYLQVTRQLTDDVGAFIRRLTALPGWDNTFFVLVSDHGEGLDSHPGVYKSTLHGHLLYESHLHVPWIIHHPQWQPARARIEQPVRLLDLMPTVLDLAGLPVPANRHGVSLVRLLQEADATVELPPHFIAETYWRPETKKIGALVPGYHGFHNFGGHRGLPEWELQRAGGGELGRETDVSSEAPEQLAMRREYIEAWEAEHPRAPASSLLRRRP